MIILLDTENKLPSYVKDVPEIAYDLIEYAENPLTIIYSGAKNLAPNVIGAGWQYRHSGHQEMSFANS